MSLSSNNIIIGTTQLSPKDIPNLKFWFDASQITSSQIIGGVLTDGAEINFLTDLSGNGATLTPGSAARRPTYETNELNGMPIMRFVPNDNLVGTNAKYDFMHSGNSTVFFVLKSNISTACYIFDSSNSESSASVGRSIAVASTNKVYDKMFAGTSGQNVFNDSSINGAFLEDNWHLLILRYMSGQVGNDHEIFVDNLLAISGQGTLSPSLSSSFTVPKFFTNGGNTAGFDGDVAEFFGYNRALTDAEISSLIGGFNWI